MNKLKIFYRTHPYLNSVLAVITIISLAFNMFLGIRTIKDQHFEAKRLGFVDFMGDILNVKDYAEDKDIDKIEATFREMDKLYLGFEPIMDKESYETVKGIVSDYYDMTIKYASRKGESYYVDLLHFQLYQESYIYPKLFKALFGKEPSNSLTDWGRKNLPKDFNPAPGITDLN